MRKFVLTLLSLAVITVSQGQEKQKDVSSDFKKNIVKLNLFSLPLKNLSLQYERGLTRKISVSLGLRLEPKGSLPLKNTIKNSMDVEDNDTADAGLDFVNNAQVSNWAITPEFRYYFGKKPLNGFYIAPFVRIGGYGVDWNYKFEKDDGSSKPVHLKGRSSAFSAGLLFGAQWHLRGNIVLDWWILGPQYGTYNVSLEAQGDFSDLTDSEKANLKKSISGVGFDGKKFDAEVTDTHVTATNKISLPGIRTGFCIGYTF